MSQIQIQDANGSPHTVAAVDNTGQTSRSNSLPVTFSTEDMQSLVPGLVTGVVNTSNTTAVTGSFRTIQIINDSTFSVLTETGATGSLVGLTIPAGSVLSGNFSAYTLISGAVRAYP